VQDRERSRARGIGWLSVLMLAVMVSIPASAGARKSLTYDPPAMAVSGPLWDTRIPDPYGGTGAPVATDQSVTVQAVSGSDLIQNVEMLVNGQRLRPEHVVTFTYGEGALTQTFTFHPEDVASIAPGAAEVAIVVRDLIADPTQRTPASDDIRGGVSVETFRVNVADLGLPEVEVTGGTLTTPGVKTGVHSLVFDARAGTGIRTARLIIDETVVQSRTFPCSPCGNRLGETFTVNTALLSDDLHDYQVEVEDAAGNVARTLEEPFETHNGPISFPATTWATLAAGQQSLFGDVDGDGAGDLVTFTTGTGALSARLSNAVSAFDAGVSWGTWPGAGSLALGDADADGMSDLAGRVGTSTDVQVRQSTGSAFGAATGWLTGATGVLSLADIDGDEAADAVLEPASSSVVRGAWSVNGGFRELADWATGVAGTRGLADVDGDGTADLVTVGETAGAVRVRRSDGAFFGTASTWATMGTFTQARFGDMNGDGRADLLLRNPQGTIVYRPSSGSDFGTAVTFGTLTQADSWHVEDVTGDGRGDVVIRYGAQVRVMVGNVQYPAVDTEEWEFPPDVQEEPEPGSVTTLAASDLRLSWGDNPLQREPADGLALGLRRIEQSGATWLRMQVLWGKWQANQDDYQQAVRTVALTAHQRGIRVIVSLTSGDRNLDTPPHHVDPDPSQFAAFARDVVMDLRPWVRRWSIWNEPNAKRFLVRECPNSNVRVSTASLYRDLYRAGRAAIRDPQVQPNAIVYFGELAEINESSRSSCSAQRGDNRKRDTLEYLQRVVESDPPVRTEAVAWHAYQHYNGPRVSRSKGIGIGNAQAFQEKLNELHRRQPNGMRRLEGEQGGRPPLYITEFGYHSSRQRRGGTKVAWRETQRARFLHQALEIAQKKKIRMLSFWELREKFNNFNEWQVAFNDPDMGTWDTGMLGRDYAADGARSYGISPGRRAMTSAAQPRRAYCRVRRWAWREGYTVNADDDTGCRWP
jgi:FG-GAP-like repeat